MSRLSDIAKARTEEQKLFPDEIVKNFMGGDSYKLNPLETLKMIAASSIFGEPAYYRTNIKDDKCFRPEVGIIEDVLLSEYKGKSTTAIFTDAIDNSLEYDFEETLKLAVTLRKDYYMRLNPQVIMVRAALHPARKDWSEKNPGKFADYQRQVMMRADEPMVQIAYYIALTGKKNNMPSILKRSIADKLSSLNKYKVNKYKNAEIGMINAVRITHANSKVLDELMKTGTVVVPPEDETWEQMRSRKVPWIEILKTTKLGHMAMLRNIRNIFTEIDDIELCKAYMEDLKAGVKEGKQFPFRYESAYNQIEKDDKIHHRPLILDTLEECIDLAIDNMPKLKGVTMALSDNSGSAWGQLTSEYGSTYVAEIDNLSAVIAGKCSDEGYVGKFGDKLKIYSVSKRNGVLTQAKTVNATGGADVGHATEGGIWKFFRAALDNQVWYDNIFIFSDMQAGTGGLYGTHEDINAYAEKYGVLRGFSRSYINVYKLILEYRKKVNPKVNVFCVQTAGYDNVLIPQMSYRCAMLTGWTGKEVQFAAEYIKQWDEIEESRRKSKNNQ